MIDRGIVKENIKRFWPVSLVAALVYFMLVFTFLWSNNHFTQSHAMANSMVWILAMKDWYIIAGIIIVPFVVVACVFGFFNSPRLTTMMYALPVSKKVLIRSCGVSGIILILLSLVGLVIPLLVPVYNIAYHPHGWWQEVYFPGIVFANSLAFGDVVNTLPVVAGFMVRMAVAKLFYFGLFWLAYSVAGNRISAFLSAALLPLLPVVIYATGVWVGQLFVFGFPHTAEQSMPSYVFAITNPAIWFRSYFSWRGRFEFVAHFSVICGIISALLCMLAYFVSCRRKVEITGNLFMFRPVKNILIFVAALIFMYVFAMISVAL